MRLRTKNGTLFRAPSERAFIRLEKRLLYSVHRDLFGHFDGPRARANSAFKPQSLATKPVAHGVCHDLFGWKGREACSAPIIAAIVLLLHQTYSVSF